MERKSGEIFSLERWMWTIPLLFWFCSSSSYTFRCLKAGDPYLAAVVGCNRHYDFMHFQLREKRNNNHSNLRTTTQVPGLCNADSSQSGPSGQGTKVILQVWYKRQHLHPLGAAWHDESSFLCDHHSRSHLPAENMERHSTHTEPWFGDNSSVLSRNLL